MGWLQSIRTEYERGKAISHRPDLAGRVHLIRQRAGEEVYPQAPQDYTDYGELYGTHVWVRKGIKIIADNLAPLRLRVVRGEDEINHPLTELFQYHNDQWSANDLWASWASTMLIGGEAFIEIVPNGSGKPMELWARRPDKMAVLPNLENPSYPRVAGYTWDDEINFEADEVIQWKFNNPLNVWRGLSLIGAARHGIVIDLYSQAWSKRLLKAGGHPTVAIYGPQGMTPDERDQIRTQYRDKYMGWDTGDEPIVLENEVYEVKPISIPPADMQWIEQRKMSREEIGAILGVPDVLMGWGPESYDTETKREGALRSLWSLTIIPLVRLRDSQLNNFFHKRRPMLGTNEVIETDLSDVEWLQRDIAGLSSAAKTYFDMGAPFAVVNEQLDLGFPEFEGDDVSYLPLNLIPAGGPMPFERVQEDIRALASAVEKLSDNGHKALPAPKNKAPQFNSIEHRALMRRQDALTIPQERAAVRAIKRFLQEQQNRLMRHIRETAKTVKQGFNQADFDDWWQELFELKEFKEYLGPVVNEQFTISGLEALQLVLGPDAPGLEMHRRTVREAIEFILDTHARKVNGTNYIDLSDLFKEAEETGASIGDISEALTDYFEGRKATHEVERIARTTMIGSHNAASMLGYEQSGVVEGTEWLAAMDNRTRTYSRGDAFDHMLAHGEFQPLGGKFMLTGEPLEYPGDPAGSPGNIINCRCTTIPVTID